VVTSTGRLGAHKIWARQRFCPQGRWLPRPTLGLRQGACGGRADGGRVTGHQRAWKIRRQRVVGAPRGTVPTDHDRVMAAQLAMLEPRVSQVRNELQVARQR